MWGLTSVNICQTVRILSSKPQIMSNQTKENLFNSPRRRKRTKEMYHFLTKVLKRWKDWDTSSSSHRCLDLQTRQTRINSALVQLHIKDLRPGLCNLMLILKRKKRIFPKDKWIIYRIRKLLSKFKIIFYLAAIKSSITPSSTKTVESQKEIAASSTKLL